MCFSKAGRQKRQVCGLCRIVVKYRLRCAALRYDADGALKSMMETCRPVYACRKVFVVVSQIFVRGQGTCLVSPALPINNPIRPPIFLTRLLRNSKTVDTQVIADARNNQMRPFAVHNSSEDEVSAEVPEFKASGDGTECRAGDGEVGVVDEQGASDHRGEHDGPVRERLVCEMREDDLGSHASED